MAIKTRETNGTGVTNKGAPLTNAELDNNFIELVADIADKLDSTALDESVDDRVNSLLQAGNGIALDYDDANNELTISSEDTEITAYNGTASTIAGGKVVCQTGVQGTDISIGLAGNNASSTMPAIGITLGAIASGSTGKIAVAGLVGNLDTSSFSAGDVLYVGTTGDLTATKPTGEANLIQNFGRALKINASSGEILVLGAGRTNDTPNLNDGNVFIGNSSNQAEARALVEADISDFGTYLTSESDTLATVTGRGATTSTNTTFSGTLTVDSHFTVNTDTLYVNAQGSQIAFGTTTAATGYDLTVKDPNGTASSEAINWKFDVSSAGTVRSVDIDFVGFTTGSIGLSGSAAGGTFLENATGGCGISAKGNGTVGLYTNGSIISPDVVLDGSGNLDISANVIVDGFVEANDFRTVGASTTALSLTATGSATVGENLTVTGDLSLTDSPFPRITLADSDGTNTRSFIDHSIDTLSFTAQNNTSNGVLAFKQYDGTTTSTAMTIDASGKVGIGTTAPADYHSLSQFVVAQSGDAGITIASGASNDGRIFFADGTTGTAESEGTIRYDHSDNTMHFSTSDTVRMSINGSGTVDFTNDVFTTGDFVAGNGSGAVALTINDGGGNANVTFNHQNRVPDQAGSSFRIETNVDSTSGGYMHFEGLSNVASGTAVTLNDMARMYADSGDFHANGNVIAYSTTISDVRLKENVEQVTGALDMLDQIRGVTFDRTDTGKKSAGVIAQELEQVMPYAIYESALPLKTGSEDEVYKLVEYDALHAVLIEAIKELRAEVEELKNGSD